LVKDYFLATDDWQNRALPYRDKKTDERFRSSFGFAISRFGMISLEAQNFSIVVVRQWLGFPDEGIAGMKAHIEIETFRCGCGNVFVILEGH
jgi:hypothetical protein